MVDAQLPPALARCPEAQGHEARAVRDAGLREADDTAIRAFAERDGWGTRGSCGGGDDGAEFDGFAVEEFDSEWGGRSACAWMQ